MQEAEEDKEKMIDEYDTHFPLPPLLPYIYPAPSVCMGHLSRMCEGTTTASASSRTATRS